MSRNSTAEKAELTPGALMPDRNHAREPAAEWVHIDELVPWEKNPRKNDEAAPKLAKLIVKLGFGSAMLAWIDPATGAKQILGGHTRKKAVKILQRKLPMCSATQRAKWHPDAIRTAETGMLPVRVRTDLTPSQAHQLAISDNKANEWADWDDELLPDVLSEFSLDDVEDMGFDPDKLDRMADDLYGLGELNKPSIDVTGGDRFELRISGPLDAQLEVMRLLGKIPGVEISES